MSKFSEQQLEIILQYFEHKYSDEDAPCDEMDRMLRWLNRKGHLKSNVNVTFDRDGYVKTSWFDDSDSESDDSDSDSDGFDDSSTEYSSRSGSSTSTSSSRRSSSSVGSESTFSDSNSVVSSEAERHLADFIATQKPKRTGAKKDRKAKKCQGKCGDGTPCKFNAKVGNFCGHHTPTK